MIEETHYILMAAPAVYPGQTVRAVLSADVANAAPVSCGLFLKSYGTDDALVTLDGPSTPLAPGAAQELTWRLDGVAPAIAQIGVSLGTSAHRAGTVYLDWLSWDGVPGVTFSRPSFPGSMWRRIWVNAMDHFEPFWPEPFHFSQDAGRGLLITGTADWTDYRVETTLVPHLARVCGIGARVQGLRRYYALLLMQPGKLRLVRALDGETVLVEADLQWEYDRGYALRLQVEGSRLRASVDGTPYFDVQDDALASGGVALLCEEGRCTTDAVRVGPAE
jgi:hypothetical protein